MSQAAAQATKKNAGKKWTLIIGAVVVLMGAAGAATQFLVRPAAADDPTAEMQARKRTRVYVPLEQFTVNLADEGGERFAQVGITLEVLDERTDKAIKAHMPAIRNSVLLLLSSKQTGELLTLEGKKQLAEQIARKAGGELGWTEPPEGAAAQRANPVAAVHFSHFIVQ
ncbi:MAG TPA: flagellar basal body-associated FliL family protein [Zeimonas sp.]|nr:flagellar basal body-associated FliL family protein [Zeimonas sp.]